ncbi:hypothetical protein AK830_g1630 [Neonectria ditissima]|uniref:Carboxylesterase type B domain-containing protein n=1 Tax=Neonectria ditissima TaxID=78410 RepID=A0A0P7BI44_9HYPO|nr:hypothetical protein AK830_g1630 [Neonectria ditissima]
MVDTNSITIKLPGGLISAARDDVTIRARGVKHASVDRFQLPAPLETWQGIMDCTGPAPTPPHIVPSLLDAVTDPMTRGRAQDEDCLWVTIAAPISAFIDGRKRPVMVFLDGDAYVLGSADLDCYEASGLVKKDIVVVGISYRLGSLGHFPVPGVASANLGLIDQITALQWIQKNITAFGAIPKMSLQLDNLLARTQRSAC